MPPCSSKPRDLAPWLAHSRSQQTWQKLSEEVRGSSSEKAPRSADRSPKSRRKEGRGSWMLRTPLRVSIRPHNCLGLNQRTPWTHLNENHRQLLMH